MYENMCDVKNNSVNYVAYNAFYDASSVLGWNLLYIEHNFSCSVVNLNANL